MCNLKNARHIGEVANRNICIPSQKFLLSVCWMPVYNSQQNNQKSWLNCDEFFWWVLDEFLHVFGHRVSDYFLVTAFVVRSWLLRFCCVLGYCASGAFLVTALLVCSWLLSLLCILNYSISAESMRCFIKSQFWQYHAEYVTTLCQLASLQNFSSDQKFHPRS